MDNMVDDHIAIILARGGSKRLPNKNILDFDGKPLIAWTIEAAINSSKFTKVIVSTDSEDIAAVSLAAGAEVPFLRISGADDYTPSSEATLTAYNQAVEYYGQEFASVSQLMANCPLRTADTIKNAIDNYIDKRFKSQLTCFKFGFMNPWWAFELDESSKANKVFADAVSKRSQDLPDLFCPTGAIWITKPSVLKVSKTFYSPNHRFFEISWEEAMDIDDIDDFNLALATKKVLKN
jgi:CMP-N-acetylneuraminic acid synthetase